MPVPYWAGRYIGLPFAEHGRTRHGCDCWGLVRLVLMEQFNIAVPSYAGKYSHTSAEKELGPLVRDVSASWQAVERGQEKLGDVIVLRLRGQPMHVGLVLGDYQMLHIERHINSAIERYLSPRWNRRVYGFFRHKGLQE